MARKSRNRRMRKSKAKPKTLFKKKEYNNIAVYYEEATNTYFVYFTTECKKDKPSAMLKEDAKLVLMGCPEYPCGRG